MRMAVTDLAGADRMEPDSAGGQRHGNDSYSKAASEERAKLLSSGASAAVAERPQHLASRTHHRLTK
jgi:hypothetical protein